MNLGIVPLRSVRRELSNDIYFDTKVEMTKFNFFSETVNHGFLTTLVKI